MTDFFLKSCFSFFIHLHGQTEPFGSCIILQFFSSFFFRLHGQPELFASNHLLQSYFSFQLIFIPHYNLLRWPGTVFGGLLFLKTFYFHLVVIWFSFLLYLFHVPSSAFFSLCSSVSEALFALNFSFLSEHCLLFGFVFVLANSCSSV